jgi:hypothetical protein
MSCEKCVYAVALREALEDIAPYFMGEHHYDHPANVRLRAVLAMNPNPSGTPNPHGSATGHVGTATEPEGVVGSREYEIDILRGLLREALDFVNAGVTAEDTLPERIEAALVSEKGTVFQTDSPCPAIGIVPDSVRGAMRKLDRSHARVWKSTDPAGYVAGNVNCQALAVVLEWTRDLLSQGNAEVKS